jgi:23S rRNA pseudouridine1911/1915/1917 synthase
VIDKPAGLVVHPAAGHETGTLVNALIAHCGASLSGIGGVRRPGIVHRLDKDTSGLLVVAKTDRAHQGLALQFADHGRTGPLERAYLAFVWGVPGRTHGTVEAALGRSTHNREKMAVVAAERGRAAITHWALEEALPRNARETVASLVRCELETGRTHQIRVHMAHIGHRRFLGDVVYERASRRRRSGWSPPAQDALTRLRAPGPARDGAGLRASGHGRDLAVSRAALPPDLADHLAAAAGPHRGAANPLEMRGPRLPASPRAASHRTQIGEVRHRHPPER